MTSACDVMAPFHDRAARDEALAADLGRFNLARIEIRAVLRRPLRRLPGIRLAAGAQAVPTPSALIDGVDALPVAW